MNKILSIDLIKFSLILTLFFASNFLLVLNAQIPTIQDCLGAIPVCAPSYTEDFVANGAGNYGNEINTSAPGNCLANENNGIWYIFTVSESGKFGFELTPNNLIDDYDWGLFNMTNLSCEDINDIPSMLVSCNAAGGGVCNGVTGANGMSNEDVQYGGCSGSPFNDFVDVIKGETYVLFVSNWSGSQNGYTIDFSISDDIGIFDVIEPFVNEIFVEDFCDNKDEIKLILSENIQCNTINNLNFSLLGPQGNIPLLGWEGASCDLGGEFERQLTLQFDMDLMPYTNYTLQINNPSQNDLLDLCDNPIESNTIDFMIDENCSEICNNGIDDDNDGLVDCFDPDCCPDPSCDIFWNVYIDLGSDVTECDLNAVQLTTVAGDFDFVWSTGSMDQTITVTSSGVYGVIITNECGDVYQDDVTVNIGDDEVTELVYEICEGDVLDIEGDDVIPTQALYEFNYLNAGGCDSLVQYLIDFLPVDETVIDTSLCIGQAVFMELINDSINQAGNYQFMGTNIYGCDSLIDFTLSNYEALFFTYQTIASCDFESSSILMEFSIPDVEIASIYLDGELQTSGNTVDSVLPGTYDLTVVDINGCQFSENVFVEKIVPPEISLVDTLIVYAGETYPIELEGNYAEDLDMNWTTAEIVDCSTCPQTSFVVLNNTVLTASVNIGGCIKEYSTVVLIDDSPAEFYIPNAFVPQRNSINKLFEIQSIEEVRSLDFTVYDRWGTLVFQHESMTNDLSWDGRYKNQNLELGVYIYNLEIEFIGKRTYNQQGSITIID